jgi:hypothetical protein
MFRVYLSTMNSHVMWLLKEYGSIGINYYIFKKLLSEDIFKHSGNYWHHVTRCKQYFFVFLIMGILHDCYSFHCHCRKW